MSKNPALIRALYLSAAILSILYVSARLILANHGAALDDAYITYRSAYNFARFNSLSYNVGQPYQGATSSFYALILGVLGKIFGAEQIPTIGEACSFIGLSATGIGLIFLFDLRKKMLIGFVAGLIYILSTSVLSSIGFETLVQLAFVIWVYYFYIRDVVDSHGSGYRTAALLAVATLVRPDGVLWIVPILLHASFVRFRDSQGSLKTRAIASAKPLIKEAGTYLLVLAPFAIAAYLYYGAIVPGTLAAKMAQTPSGWFASFAKGTEQAYFGSLATPWQQTILICAAIGLMFVREVKIALFLSAGVLVYVFAYTTLNVPSYVWYLTPIDLLLAVLAGVGVNALIHLAGRIKFGAIPAYVITLYLIFLFAGDRLQGAAVYHQGLLEDPKWTAYRGLGSFVAEQLPAGSSLGYCEVGRVGWTCRGKIQIVDQLMLATPGDYSAISRKIVDSAFRKNLPTVIAESPVLLGTNRGHPWFRQNYEYWTAYPVPRNQPLSLKEAEAYQKENVCEMDLWRRRATPLSIEEGKRLAAIDAANRSEFAKY